MLNTCPISKNKVDENVIRLIAFLILILVISSYLLSNWIMLFVFLDFLARIFYPKISILKNISILILHNILKIKSKPIDAAPKRFSAMIGLSFALILFLLQMFTNQIFTINILYIIFISAIFLETFLKYCVGCKIYSIIYLLKRKLIKK